MTNPISSLTTDIDALHLNNQEKTKPLTPEASVALKTLSEADSKPHKSLSFRYAGASSVLPSNKAFAMALENAKTLVESEDLLVNSYFESLSADELENLLLRLLDERKFKAFGYIASSSKRESILDKLTDSAVICLISWLGYFGMLEETKKLLSTEKFKSLPEEAQITAYVNAYNNAQEKNAIVITRFFRAEPLICNMIKSRIKIESS